MSSSHLIRDGFYKLVHHVENGKGTETLCTCPGAGLIRYRCKPHVRHEPRGDKLVRIETPCCCSCHAAADRASEIEGREWCMKRGIEP